MSRFFHGGSSDSSDSDSSDAESITSSLSNSSREDTKARQPAVSSIWTKDANSDGSSDEGPRVIISAKDKFIADLKSVLSSLESHSKEDDFVKVSEDFNIVVKLSSKISKILGNIPAYFLKALINLDAIEKGKEELKKMNAINAKAYVAVKSKLKKFMAGYASQLDSFKKGGQQEEESEEEEESESDDEPKNKKASAKKQVGFDTKEEVNGVKTGKSKLDEITSENFFVKLTEVIEARGKKGTDRDEQIKILDRLLVVASNPIQKIKVLLNLIAARYDYNTGMASYLSVEMWKDCEKNINQVFSIIETYPNIQICDNADDDLLIDNYLDNSSFSSNTQRPGSPQFKKDSDPVSIRGNLVSVLSRLDEEFTKSMQNTDPHTMDYIERLRDEVGLYALIVRAEFFHLKANDVTSISFLKMLRLEHVYYKFNNVVMLMEENARKIFPFLGPAPKDATALVHSLCIYLYKNAPDRIRTQSVLCHVYHHALNKRFYDARDLLLMSHLQENIQHTDISTQVLFNRAMVQIGICAFRLGMISECHYALNDIMASIKTRDILAQGTQLQKYQQPSDNERKERLRMLPFHLHINLDLLESIQLTVSMLLEIPSIAANSIDSPKKIISKHFRRLLEYTERQFFTGPPETARDYIMQASQALANGNWEKCRDFILQIKVWELLPDSDSIRTMLTQKIKEEGIRTFLFAFGKFYENIDLDHISEQFKLERKAVYKIVSKMILNDELHATVDLSTNTLILHRVDPNRVQHLALMLCDNASKFMDKIVENRFPTHTTEPGPEFTQSKQGARIHPRPSRNQPNHQNKSNVRRNSKQDGVTGVTRISK